MGSGIPAGRNNEKKNGVQPDGNTDRWKNRQTERCKRDRRADAWTGGETDRETSGSDRRMQRRKGGQINGQADRETYRKDHFWIDCQAVLETTIEILGLIAGGCCPTIEILRWNSHCVSLRGTQITQPLFRFRIVSKKIEDVILVLPNAYNLLSFGSMNPEGARTGVQTPVRIHGYLHMLLEDSTRIWPRVGNYIG